MTTLRLWARFFRAAGPRATDVLAIVAFMFSTGAALVVMGGVLAFRERARIESLTTEFGGVDEFTYMLSIVALSLLIPSIWVLSQSAVRLAITRRDARLSALRLAGATRGQVAGMTVLDTLWQTLAGILLGIGLYFALVPPLSLLEFGGRPFEPGEMILHPLVILAVAGAVLLIALLSSAISLVTVSLSPLGVSSGSVGGRPTLMRLALIVVVAVAWVAVVALGQVLPQQLFADDAMFVFMLVVFTLMGIGMMLVGPLVVWCIAAVVAAVARDARTLLAARQIMAQPQTAFNVVGPLTAGVMAGGIASLAAMFGGEEAASDPHLATLLTGALLTIGIAGVLGAVFAGVAQSARILDQQEVLRAQRFMGMDQGVMVSSTMRGSIIPLATMVGTGTVGTVLLMLPFFSFLQASLAPIGAWLLLVALATAAVLIATFISTRLIRQVTKIEP